MSEIPASLQPNAVDTLPEASAPAAGTTPVLDTVNKSVVHLPYEQLEAALKDPRYAAHKTAKFPIINEAGESLEVDGTDIHKALNSGFRLVSPQELHHMGVEQQFGDSEGLAALAGAVRSATFGGSDQFLTKTGLVHPETLSGLEEANPKATLAGEGLGIVVPAILSDGTTLLGKGAQGAATGIEAAAGAGKIAEKFAANQLSRLGVKGAAAKAIAEKLPAAFVGSAVEGSFYGAGQLISEEALGDANFNAEALASHIGTAALMGGAFGSALAGAGALAEAAAPMVQKSIGLVKDSLLKETDGTAQAAKIFGISPSQFEKLKTRSPGVVEDMQAFLRDDLKLSVGDSAHSLSTKLAEVKETSGQRINNILTEIDKTLTTEGVRSDLLPKGSEIFEPLAKKIEEEHLAPLRNAPGAGAEFKQVENYVADLRKLAKEDQPFTATMLQDLKRTEDRLLKFNKEPGKWTLKEQMIYDTRTALRGEIDAVAKRLESEGLAGNLASELRDANRLYSNSATLGKFIEAKAAKGHGISTLGALAGMAGEHGIIGGLIGGMLPAMKDYALDAGRKLIVMGKIETAKQSMAKAISKTADTMFQPAKGIASSIKPVVVTGLLSSPLAQTFENGKGKKPSSKQEAYQNITNNLTQFQMDPTSYVNRVSEHTKVVGTAAPNTAGELDRVAYSSLNFLSSKLPKTGKDSGLFSSYNKARMPSTLEQAKFERYLTAVDRPMTVLHDLQKGVATREQTQALKAVYPALYNGLQMAIMDRMPELHQTMPFNRRIQLGLLFDMPTDGSMLNQNFMGLQANFDQQNQARDQASEGAVNSTQGGLKELNKSDRLSTGNEELANEGAGGE